MKLGNVIKVSDRSFLSGFSLLMKRPPDQTGWRHTFYITQNGVAQEKNLFEAWFLSLVADKDCIKITGRHHEGL